MNLNDHYEKAVEQRAAQMASNRAGIAPEPKDPGPIDRTREMLGYLRELDGLQMELRRRVFGPFPESGEANQAKRPEEPCLDEMLRDACSRAAMAVGEMKTILGRL